MMVGVMRPEEHSYANYDAEHYFENTIVPVGESSPQIQKITVKTPILADAVLTVPSATIGVFTVMNKGSQNP